jgi:hypothetical protein
MGSKSRFAAEIVGFLPPTPCLVDIFAGGCAVTHAALLSGKFRRIIANDISDAPQLFIDAANGKYRDEKRWISRDDFFALKDTDPYVRLCWSFGNNGRSYLYSREVEEWKHALHLAKVHGDTSMLANMGISSDGSRADIMAHHEEYKRRYAKWWLARHGYECKEVDVRENIRNESGKLRSYLLEALRESGLTQAEVGKRLGTQMQGHYFGKSQWALPTQEHYERMQTFMPLPTPYMEIIGLRRLMQSLESLQRLQSLERLQSLQSLESLQRLQSLESLQRLQSLERLETRRGDYTRCPLPEGCIVYCDPPYRNTHGYGTAFDHEAFYSWAEQCPRPVIISEYAMPEDRFACVWERHTTTSMAAQGAHKKRIERMFVPLKQIGMWRILTGTLFFGDC